MPSKKRSGKKRSSALDTKLKVSGALADIIGKSSVSRLQATSKIWVYIKKNKLQAKSGSDVSVTYGKKKKAYKGGQVILCGKDKKLKKLCGGKSKIAMVELPGFLSKYLK